MSALKEVLHQIYEEHGALTPALIVDLARDPNHPLHEQFQWDDTLAGEAFRRGQARSLISRVRVRYVDPANEVHTIRARAYHSVPTPNGPVYRSTDDVVTDPFVRRMLIQRMHRDWEAMLARYQAFEELWLMVKQSIGANPNALDKAS